MIWPDDFVNQVHCGDAQEFLSQMPDNSVHMVCTSPPYWGLRDYKIEPRIWGGDKNCQHEWKDNTYIRNNDQTAGQIQQGNKGSVGRDEPIKNAFCLKCGAWLGCLGLEPTPEMYTQHLVGIFREVKRVLRKDGTLWLNLGDSYVGGGAKTSEGALQRRGAKWEGNDELATLKNKLPGLKPKDLCGIPWRVALALQADGWWFRSDIVWNKPNPMPESVSGSRWERHRIKVKETIPNDWLDDAIKQSGIDSGRHGGNTGLKQKQAKFIDCPGCPKCSPNDGLVLRMSAGRPTRSHEYIFLLTKSDSYYFDSEAVREIYDKPLNRWGGPSLKRDTSKTTAYKEMQKIGYSSCFRVGREMRPNPSGRNVRSVWTITTKPFSEAHFATFPPELPERCIKAGTSERGVCPKCGASWVRILNQKTGFDENDICRGCGQPKSKHIQSAKSNMITKRGMAVPCSVNSTIGWRTSCKCNAGEPIPATVLDLFGGAGTTGMMAKQLGRNYILIDIKSEYCEMMRRRIAKVFYQRKIIEFT